MTTNKTATPKTTARKVTTTKKPTTAKTTNPKLEKVTEEVVVQTPVIEEKTLRSVSQIGQHEMFEVRSLVHNPLIYIDKRSGNVYEWINYGDVEIIPFSDLLTMRNRDRKFIEDMRVCFDDEEIIHAFNLENKYNDVFSAYDGDILLDLPAHELREVLPTLPKGIKNSLISRAREIAKEEVESGEFNLLDSTVKMSLIEEHLGLDLKLLLDK